MWSRRAVLGGMGAALALPWLESTRASSPTEPRRLVVFSMPNGMYMPDWTPGTAGRGWSATPLLEPLDGVRGDLLVLSGLSSEATAGEPHASANGALLTGQPFDAAAWLPPQLDFPRSFDRVVADHVGAGTRISSLELGSEGTFLCGFAGGSEAYCTNLNVLSWDGPGRPRPKEVDLRRVYARLFSDGTMTGEAEAIGRIAWRRSVLDVVGQDVARLRARVGAADRARLESWTTAVRELEVGISEAAPLPPELDAAALDLRGRIDEADLTLDNHVSLMLDLVVMALRADRTRVVTYMLGNGRSERAFPFLGLTDGHHWLSHHHGDPWQIAAIRDIGRWETGWLAALIDRLATTNDMHDRSLLETTAVLGTCSFGDPDQHDTRRLPVVLAGRVGGLRPGRHVVYGGHPSIQRLYVSVAQALGVPMTQFGASGTSALTDLT